MIRNLQYFFIVLLLGLSVFTDNLQAEGKEKSKKDQTEVKKEKETTKETKEEIPDYSKGFKQFYVFGLPDVKNAEYIKLTMYSSAIGSDNYLRYQAGIDGNAWLLSENKKSGKAQIILNQGAEVTVYDQQKLSEEIAEKQRKRIEKSKKKNRVVHITLNNLNDGKLAGQWNKANLKKDAEKITEHIQKEMKKKHFWGRKSLGSWFLFAIHLNQKGLKKEANKLAGVLFEAGGGKRIVILQALNSLADAQYGAAYAQFKADHNWKKYGENVVKIYNLYKKGWKKAEGVKKLSDLITERLNNSASLKVKGATKDEKKLITELINKKISVIPAGLWILDDKSEDIFDEDDAGAIVKIWKKGIKSVPFLIKLLGNETLVVADKDDLRMNTMFRGNIVHNNYSFINRSGGDNVFRNMKRPMTLGEIARQMLEPIIGKEDESDTSFHQTMLEPGIKPAEDFSETCESWYKKNKNKTPIELAEIYIRNGSKAQRANAVAYLLNNNAKDKYQVIENYLLNAERDKHNNSFRDKLAVNYAGKRGVEAKEFAEKYIAILDPDGEVQRAAKESKKGVKKKKKESDSSDSGEIFIRNSDDDGGMSEWKRKRILNIIERLRGMTSDETVEDILNDILGDKKKWDNKINSLIAERIRISDKGIDNKLALLLKGAAAAAEKKREKLFTDLMTIAVRCSKNITVPDGTFNFMNQNSDMPTKLEKPDPMKNAEEWKTLISKKLLFEKYSDEVPTTIGDVSAVYYEVIFGGKNIASLTLYAHLLGKRLYTQIKKRALKRIAGTDEDQLPPLPSVSKLTAEERDKKIKTVLKKVRTSRNLRKAVNSLSLDECILFKEGLDKDQKLNKRLFPIANKVVRVTAKMAGAKKFAKFAEKKFSAKMADELREFVLNAMRNKKHVYCRIYRKPSLGGITIFIGEIPEKQLPYEIKNKDKDAKDILVTTLKVPGAFNSVAYWPLSEKDDSVESTEKSEDDDLFGDMEEEIMNDSKDFYSKKQASFNDKVKIFEAGKLNSMLSGGIYFSGGVE
jgi:hypothetical protein